MMYLISQNLRLQSADIRNSALAERVPPVTDRMYAALAAKMEQEPLVRAARRLPFIPLCSDWCSSSRSPTS